MTNWMDEAACVGMDVDIFFPSYEDVFSALPAKRVCAACPVVDECRNHALRTYEIHGVWGGLSSNERRRMGIGKRQESAHRCDDCGLFYVTKRMFGPWVCTPCRSKRTAA